MRELNLTLAAVHIGALDVALRAALPGQIVGLSTYGTDRPLSIWLADSASQADQTAAAANATAHDPVFLSADKTDIAADGLDTATITVQAPKPGAAPVSLLIGGVAVPVSLTNGVGTVTIRSSDPAIVAISVQNPQNRTADQIVVTAR